MTANAETIATEPSVITNSQEEGVCIGVELSNVKLDDNKEVSTNYAPGAKSSIATDVNFRRGYSRTSSDGLDGEDVDLENILFSTSEEDTGGPMKAAEKSVEMTPQATPVTDTSNDNEETKPPPLGYYTSAPSTKASGLSFAQTLREYRHNRCIMTPMSTLVILALLVSSLVTLLFTIPQFIIGLLLGPLVKKQFWLVEFFYRWDVVGWCHVKLMEMADKKNGGSSSKKGNTPNTSSTAADIPRDSKKKLKHLGLLGHSDTIHQRISVVPGRIYVHSIPQFVDNVCYLIVCLPDKVGAAGSSGLPIIGVLIDVGEAKRALAYIDCIYEHFYEQEYPRSDFYRNSGGEEGNISTAGMGIEIHAILSTHRHHDHTAGVRKMINCLEQARCRLSKCVVVSGGADEQGESERIYNLSAGKVVVVGGAVESVPHCNLFVKNKCFIPLPCVRINGTSLVNDMNSVVCIECIGVPSHTRGSIVYALRNHPESQTGASTSHAVVQSHLFTGDALFSGGGGVPFEADVEFTKDNFAKNPNKLKSKNGSSNFRPGAGTLSTERCFAEVLTRATEKACEEERNVNSKEIQAKTLLYPGHEYTTDLMMRQFDPKTISSEGHWTRMAPSVFFETASHYYTSAHKRALPQGQKLLSLPVPLSKEMIVNPNFRSLKRRGEHIINALKLWYEFGAKNQIPRSEVESSRRQTTRKNNSSSAFRTVYAQDLDTIVQDLRSGKLSTASAADRIELLQARVNEKLIGRRPIPNHLPSHKNVYLGVVALAILGSPPSGATVSDALVMDLAAPVESSDFILISKSRLITALRCLDLLVPDEPIRIQDIINLLWKEARLDDETRLQTGKLNNTDEIDLMELGLLKLALFGVSLYQPSAKFCLPCRNPKPVYDETSWTTRSKMKRTSGELVRHEANKCPLCQDVADRSHSVYI